MSVNGTGPRTYNVTQCNELRRAVFYEALSKARTLIAAPELDDAKVNALAAIAEACGNDLVSDADVGDD